MTRTLFVASLVAGLALAAFAAERAPSGAAVARSGGPGLTEWVAAAPTNFPQPSGYGLVVVMLAGIGSMVRRREARHYW